MSSFATTAIPQNVSGRAQAFITFSEAADTAKEIFDGRTYPRIPFISDAAVAVDIGANVGAAAVFFSTIYPNAAIHALEPAQMPFRLLTLNARLAPQIHAYNIGLYSRDARMPLYLGKKESGTGSVGRSTLNSEQFETVTLRHAEGWLAEQGIGRIDVLKIDTEGCEVAILESIAARLPGIRAIYFEFHSEEDRLRIDALLHSTHVIFAGRVLHPHRGEFCYVARDAFPSPEWLAARKIEVRI